MVIDRSKHNKYSVNLVYTPSSTALTEQQTALSGSSLTIYISGGSGSGSGLTEEQLKKLESIEEGALVNQNAFSTVLVLDGSITNEITAQNPSDTIKLTYVNPIEISLVDGNIQISYVGNDSLWSLDESGNLWTDRNVYSTKEISAYGFREGGVSPGGASYLYELGDVDYESAFSPINKGILQYNSTLKKWVVTDGSNIKPDLSGYATQTYVNQQIAAIVGSAPEVLDTIYEIAEALNNDPDYVKDIADNLSNLTNRVVKLEDMFEWDNGVIKAKADLYGVGEISAYGYNSGSTPSGAQNLSELLDVDLTNLADQCILQYNILTKKWEATDGSNIKPDLSEYATRSWVISQLDTTSSNLRNEFDTSISDVNSLLVVINGNITTIQGNITSLQNSVSSINEEILSIKANITTIKGDITNIKAALELLNNMFEWDGTRIKAKADLYGVGEISAYGYQDGSAGSGAQYLYELLDVTLTELTSGLLLQWDGSKWININKDEVGLNESELLQYLTENNYAKKSDIPKVIDWTNITSKPSWITDEKPTYSWTDITNKPTVFTTNIGNISDLNSSWNSLLKNKPTAYITRWPSFSEVTNKPTTLSGYGITDGVNSITLTGSGNAVTSASINGHVITLTKGSTFSLSTHNHDSVYVNVTGDTMTGTLTLPTIVVNTRILLGNAYIEYDSTNNAVVIKNKTTNQIVNFYATGEVSAYGYGDGTNPSGVTYLSELEDVKLTSIAENDMLVWNGSVWVNTPMADITPELNVDNITDLNASWRTLLKSAPSAYVTRWPSFSEITSKPTTLAGYGITDAPTKTGSGASGTWNISITGALSPKSFTAASDIDFSRPVWTATANITDVPSMSYAVVLNVGNGMLRTFQIWNARNDAQLYWRPAKLDMSGYADVHKLLDNFNYTTILDTRYVKRTGDTMTGALITKITDGSGVRIAGEDGYGYLQLGNMNSTSTAQKGIICGYRVSQLASLDIRTSNLSGGVTINRNKIWHAGNDGSGSSLDADLLDGYHGSSSSTANTYVLRDAETRIKSGSLMYTVHSAQPAGTATGWYRIFTFSNSDAVGSSAIIHIDRSYISPNNESYIFAITLAYNGGISITQLSGHANNRLITKIRVDHTNSGTSYVDFYLGVSSNYNNAYSVYGSGRGAFQSPTLVESLTGTAYEFETTNGCKSSRGFVGTLSGNASSATKLATARTIWGQSFDGTANVSGSLSTVGSITGASDLTLIGKSQIIFRFNNKEDNSIALSTNTFGPVLNANNNIDLGISSARWRNVYSVLGNFSGAVTMSSNITTGSYINSNWNNSYTITDANTINSDNATFRKALNSVEANTVQPILAWSNQVNNYGYRTRYSISSIRPTSGEWGRMRLAVGNSDDGTKIGCYIDINGAGTVSVNGSMTITNTLAARNGIITDYTSGTWISMATRTNLIYSDTNNSTSNAHALFRVKNSGGDAIVFGGLGTYCGFYGFTSETISAETNEYNWATDWDVATGKLTHNKAMSVYGAVTLLSTLSVTGTSTFTGAITVNGESTFSKLLHVNGGAHTLNNKYFSTFNTSGTYCSMLGIDGNNYGFAGTTEKIAGMVLKSYDLFLFTFNGSANYVTINKSGIVCKGEITAFSSSDIRLKKNLKELKAINTLRKINTFEYDWTEEALLLKANKNVHDYGIIAQELESIIPEAVTHDMYGKGYLGIDYTKLIPFTISAIKEVDDEVTTLKKRVKELEDRLSKYESSVK